MQRFPGSVLLAKKQILAVQTREGITTNNPTSPVKHETRLPQDRFRPHEERETVWHRHCVTEMVHPVGASPTKKEADT